MMRLTSASGSKDWFGDATQRCLHLAGPRPHVMLLASSYGGLQPPLVRPVAVCLLLQRGRAGLGCRPRARAELSMPPAHAAALLPHSAHEAARVGGRRLHRGCTVSRTQSSHGTAAARWLGVCGCYASRSAAVPPEAIRVKAPQLLPRPRLSAVNSVNIDAAHYWRCTTLLAYDVQLLAAPPLGSLSSLGRQAAAAELLQPNSAVSIRAASDAAPATGVRVGGPARGAARRRCRTVLRTRKACLPWSQGLAATASRPLL